MPSLEWKATREYLTRFAISTALVASMNTTMTRRSALILLVTCLAVVSYSILATAQLGQCSLFNGAPECRSFESGSYGNDPNSTGAFSHGGSPGVGGTVAPTGPTSGGPLPAPADQTTPPPDQSADEI